MWLVKSILRLIDGQSKSTQPHVVIRHIEVSLVILLIASVYKGTDYVTEQVVLQCYLIPLTTFPFVFRVRS